LEFQYHEKIKCGKLHQNWKKDGQSEKLFYRAGDEIGMLFRFGSSKTRAFIGYNQRKKKSGVLGMLGENRQQAF